MGDAVRVRAADRCRHRNSWLMSGGSWEWCYECGAVRRMFESGPAQVTPLLDWCRPTGPRGENPWRKWHDRNEKRRTTPTKAKSKRNPKARTP